MRLPETCQESQAEGTGTEAGAQGPWATTGEEVGRRGPVAWHQPFALKSHRTVGASLDSGPWGLSRGKKGRRLREEGPGLRPGRGKGF